MSKSKPAKPARRKAAAVNPSTPRCGLCGKRRRLTRTECCGQWICDDEHKYVLFSYARNSCHRNQRHYTLCAHHHDEGHAGSWQDCSKCRANFPTEIYVWYGTNEYNFQKLVNPPDYAPTTCVGCGTIISLSEDGYSHGPEGYRCDACTEKALAEKVRKRTANE
jgi:hypothetical protein